MLTMSRNISDPFPSFGVRDNRPQGNSDDDILTTLASLVSPHAVLAVLCLVFSQVPEIDQGIQTRITFQVHAAATATVTTIGTTVLDVLFPAERGRTVAPVAGDNCDIGFINEFHAAILSLISCVRENPGFSKAQKKPRLSGVFVQNQFSFRKFPH
jgi:hypothetical protein